MKPRTFEQFVSKYLAESRGMLNESKMMFQNADITISTKVIEKPTRERMDTGAARPQTYLAFGAVMIRFSISDFGTFDVVARGGDLGRAEIDDIPKFTRGAASGGGFKTLVKVKDYSGGLYPKGDGPGARTQKCYFLANKPGLSTIALYEDLSDKYYPAIELETPKGIYGLVDLF